MRGEGPGHGPLRLLGVSGERVGVCGGRVWTGHSRPASWASRLCTLPLRVGWTQRPASSERNMVQVVLSLPRAGPRGPWPHAADTRWLSSALHFGGASHPPGGPRASGIWRGGWPFAGQAPLVPHGDPEPGPPAEHTGLLTTEAGRSWVLGCKPSHWG